MKDFFLLRHGEARSGPSKMDRDFCLTPKGKEQAHACGRRLKRVGVNPGRIYCSRLTRACQTAEIVSQHVPAPLEVREDLIEHGSAVLLLDGSVEAVSAQYPEKISPDGRLKMLQGGREGLNWGFSVGGEDLRTLHSRARNAWESIVAAHPEPGGQYIIVAHGSFLAAMLTEALGLSLSPVWNFQFANAGCLHLRLYPGDSPAHVHSAFCVPGPEESLAEGWSRSESFDTDK